MKVERFEDLRCWQAARELVQLVFRAAETGALAKDLDTKFQLKKAALSSMNNIAEGFGCFGKKDSIRFYDISQSSAQEVRSMSYVLSDLQYLTEKQIEEIRSKSVEARNLTLAFIRHQRKGLQKSRPESPADNNKKNLDPQKSQARPSTPQHFNTPTH